MKLTRAPWKTRALSVDEILVLVALHSITPLIDEIRTADPHILELMVIQRTLARELGKRTGLATEQVLAVLVLLERKGLVVPDPGEERKAAAQ